MKTYDNLTKEQQILKALGETQTFKILVDELPDRFDIKDLRISFIYNPQKETIWEDGTLVSDNNICDSEVRKRMKDMTLVKETDSKGDVILYPDD